MTQSTKDDAAETTSPDIVFEDQPIDLSDTRPQDYFVLAIFWLLAFVVFLQFFTRYVLNDSLGWTEEVARFLLIAVTFVGSVMATRKQSHIAVEFLFRWMPRWLRWLLQVLIDLISIAFFAGLAWFSIELAQKTRQMMVSIDLPKAYVYWFVAACFALMALYALINLGRHIYSRTSRLIDPELYQDAIQARD